MKLTTTPALYANVQKSLNLGSGGIYGQAGEFVCSCSQVLKVFKQKSIYTILVNPNIETIEMSKGSQTTSTFSP
jgi:carbamoyl-phosphate synthase large subunit